MGKIFIIDFSENFILYKRWCIRKNSLQQVQILGRVYWLIKKFKNIGPEKQKFMNFKKFVMEKTKLLSRQLQK